METKQVAGTSSAILATFEHLCQGFHFHCQSSSKAPHEVDLLGFQHEFASLAGITVDLEMGSTLSDSPSLFSVLEFLTEKIFELIRRRWAHLLHAMPSSDVADAMGKAGAMECDLVLDHPSEHVFAAGGSSQH